jgi:ABC-type uncharacterized transport system YnjBCD substrate-binding protein
MLSSSFLSVYITKNPQRFAPSPCRHLHTTNKSGMTHSDSVHIFSKCVLCNFAYFTGLNVICCRYKSTAENLTVLHVSQFSVTTYFYLYFHKCSPYGTVSSKSYKSQLEDYILCHTHFILLSMMRCFWKILSNNLGIM